MSYTDNNPYLLNIIPFYNVADPTNSSTANGSTTTADTTTSAITALQGMVNTTSYTLSADTLQSFTSGQSITLQGPASVTDPLSVDTLNPYTIGQPVTIHGRLQVTSTIVCQALYQTSDKRFKQQIQPLQGALSTLCELKGVTYTKDGQHQTGFLAQDVLSVVPDAVHKDSQGFYSVDYSRIIPLLVEAVKELVHTNHTS